MVLSGSDGERKCNQKLPSKHGVSGAAEVEWKLPAGTDLAGFCCPVIMKGERAPFSTALSSMVHGGFLSRPALGFLFLLPGFSFALQLHKSGYIES